MTTLETSPPQTSATGRAGARGNIPPLVFTALALACAVAAYTTTSVLMVGVYSIGVLLALILNGLHVGAAMGLSGLLAIWVIYSTDGVVSAVRNLPYDNASGWSISVLPMFIFMGFLLWRSTVTNKLYEGAGKWLNWMPGGLAVTTKVAGAAMGAASGSSVGIAYALGRIALPEMLRKGYPKRIALTSVLMAGSGGQLIPPSIILVVYAGVAGTSVGQQLIAGLIPGLILVSVYIAYLAAISYLKRNSFGPEAKETVSWSERVASLKNLWQVPLVILVVVGGLYSGFFTATEAGAVGAFGALVLLVIYQRRNSPRAVGLAAKETVASTGSIFLLLIGSAILARALALTGITQATTDLIIGSDMGRVQFLLLLVVFYIILGLFLDPIAMVLLTVPLLLPVMPSMGIEPLWFGVFVVLLGELAVVTPPVGVLLFVIFRIAQDKVVNLGQRITIQDVMMASLTFIPITILVALILIFWPEVATFLPSISFAES
ncbi:MAG TPA: TRAP transporter large permease subunit [Brevibacterium sp.]|nr:TRAP transporter large permease subunit [Brevibacterium sp.]